MQLRFEVLWSAIEVMMDFLYTAKGARIRRNVANLFKNIPNAIIRHR